MALFGGISKTSYKKGVSNAIVCPCENSKLPTMKLIFRLCLANFYFKLVDLTHIMYF